MEQAPQEGVTYTQEQPCGCRHGTKDGVAFYRPCLPCALKNAGIMLQEAGLRLEEAEAERRAQAAELADSIVRERERQDGWIGGSD